MILMWYILRKLLNVVSSTDDSAFHPSHRYVLVPQTDSFLKALATHLIFTSKKAKLTGAAYTCRKATVGSERRSVVREESKQGSEVGTKPVKEPNMK